MMQNHRRRSDPAPVDRAFPGRLLRWAVNVWLVYHIAAIIIAPAAVAPSSGLIQSAWGFFQPYLQLLYLEQRLSFLRTRAGRKHAAGIQGRTRRRDRRRRADSQPRRSSLACCITGTSC